MARGRKPTPTQLKLVSGERRTSRINKDEPVPDDGIPQCPSKDRELREVWDYTAGQLSRMRVLTQADRDVLMVFCQAVITWRKAQEIIAEQGLILEFHLADKFAAAANPAIGIAVKAENTILRCAGEFGLTPAARTRIQVGAQDVKPSGAARLLSS